MSFGYSAGDFIAVASLVVQAGLALRDVGGSAQEYRNLHLYLTTVQRILGEVDKLESPDGLAATVTAIKATALTCQHPLREFLNSIEHYRPSLAAGQSTGLLRDSEKKLRWRATSKMEAAQRLQAQLAGYVGSINMLMGLYQIRYNSFASKGLNSSLRDLQIGARESQEANKETKKEIKEGQIALSKEIQRTSEKSLTVFGALQTSVTSTFCGITELIGDLKDTMLRSYSINVDTYNLLVKLQNSPSPPHTRHTYFQEPMQVEDAFGRIFPVPAEYNFEMLEAVVKAKFSNGPGNEFVKRGDWQLFESNDDRYILGNWWATFRPGMKIKMAMIVPRNTARMRCPRPKCLSAQYFDAPYGGKICASCNVWFDDLPFEIPKSRSQNPVIRTGETGIQSADFQLDITRQTTQEEPSQDLLYLKNVRFRNRIRGPTKEEPLFVRAVYGSSSRDKLEKSLLFLNEGDIIQVFTQLENGWSDGISNGHRGWFPINFCTLLDDVTSAHDVYRHCETEKDPHYHVGSNS